MRSLLTVAEAVVLAVAVAVTSSSESKSAFAEEVVKATSDVKISMG